MAYFKIVKASELGDSWSPRDHIHEYARDQLIPILEARRKRAQKALELVARTEEELAAAEARVAASPARRLGDEK